MASTLRVAGRFISGRPLDGKQRTDCGFWRAGTRPLTKGGHASKWAMLPGYKRAQWRLLTLWFTILATYGAIWHTFACIVGLCVCAGIGLIVAALITWHWIRVWRHHRAWTRPLHRALAPEMRVTDWSHDWIHIPRGFEQGGQTITLDLPDQYAPNTTTRDHIQTIIADKLNLQDPTFDWRMTGRRQHVIVRVATPPPDATTLADVIRAGQGLPDTTLVAGLGQRSDPVYWDLLTDSPHALVSGGSGAGKSVLVRSLTAQAMHNGGLVICLDNNRTSQPWLRDMPNAYIARDIGRNIHPALCWLGDELERRAEAADDHSDKDGNLDPAYGPRIWLIAEEMNMVRDMLTAHWQEIREQGSNSASPALAAVARALAQGRALRVHVIATAQMATVASLGNPAMRENFAWRAIGRYTQNQWKMLAPEICPMPRKSKHRGRWQIVTGGEAHECQVPYLTMQEARDHATTGIITPAPDHNAITSGICGVVSVARVVPDDRVPVVAVDGVQVRAIAPVTVGLREACATGVLSLSLSAARTARGRPREGFPEPVDRLGDRPGAEWLYSVEALRAWEAGRVRAAKLAAAADHPEGYEDVHAELRRTFGPAKRRVCGSYGSGVHSQVVGCGRFAAEWGYDYSDPNEVRDVDGRNPFTRDVHRYVALCRSCHRRFDHGMRLREQSVGV